MDTRRSRYLRHRFPSDIISHAVWLYHRYCLSFRDVEDLLAERGIIVSYETIWQWCRKFGPDYARRLKRREGRLGDTWFLDEVFVTINGQRQYLWRAVDQDGDLIDLLRPTPPGRACGAEILSETLEQSATGTDSSRDRQAGQLPCRTSGGHALGSPTTQPQTRTIAPKSPISPRDNENVRCGASRHPPMRSGSCRFTASFRICVAWGDTTCERCIIACCGRELSQSGPR